MQTTVIRLLYQIFLKENGIEYYFTVHAKNGDWEGLPSKEVACTPEEQAAPGRVGGVRVEPKTQGSIPFG